MKRVVREVEHDPKAEAKEAAKQAVIRAAREKAAVAAASMDLYMPRGGTVEGHGFDANVGKSGDTDGPAMPAVPRGGKDGGAAVTTTHAPSVARVLCIAEKPSVAKAVANALSNGKMRSRNCGGKGKLRVHEFFQYFPPAKGILFLPLK